MLSLYLLCIFHVFIEISAFIGIIVVYILLEWHVFIQIVFILYLLEMYLFSLSLFIGLGLLLFYSIHVL